MTASTRALRAFRTLGALAIVSLWVPALSAADFHLDGRSISGVWIGEADGIVHVLTLEGERERFDRNELLWIDWHAPVPPELEEKAVAARERFVVERRKEARRLIRELERADEPERPSLIARFDGFDEAQSLHAFSDGLESKAEHVRELSFERLSSFESEAAVVPLVRVHLKSRDAAFGARALETARRKQPELTRQLYEYVAQTAGIDHRVRAIETLQGFGDRAALPALVRVLAYVDMNVRATLARTKEIREVPVNLGGVTSAAQGVTIDLPQMELIQVQTSVRIPTESLQRLGGAAVGALESISGRAYGNDVGAWADYVRSTTPSDSPGERDRGRPSE